MFLFHFPKDPTRSRHRPRHRQRRIERSMRLQLATDVALGLPLPELQMVSVTLLAGVPQDAVDQSQLLDLVAA